MFTTLIVQPIFNLLVFIYAMLPGHDFGLSILIFTVVVRLLLWPLVKKQLHHTRAIQKLQPELKRIKQATKGDRQKEQTLMMELYKERQVNPFASLGLALVQLPILFGLYMALKKMLFNPQQMIDFTYPFIRELSWVKQLAGDISKFHPTFLGLVDLHRPALDKATNVWYIPGLVLVAGSAVVQYLQSKQLLPNANDKKGIRQILREASAGKKTDQSEMQAATGRFTSLMIPIVIFFVTLGIASALSLYWFVGGLLAFWQQSRVLNQDEEEMEVAADKPGTKKAAKPPVIEGEVIAKKPKTTKKRSTTAKAPKPKGRKR